MASISTSHSTSSLSYVSLVVHTLTALRRNSCTRTNMLPIASFNRLRFSSRPSSWHSGHYISISWVLAVFILWVLRVMRFFTRIMRLLIYIISRHVFVVGISLIFLSNLIIISDVIRLLIISVLVHLLHCSCWDSVTTALWSCRNFKVGSKWVEIGWLVIVLLVNLVRLIHFEVVVLVICAFLDQAWGLLVFM